MLELGQPLHGYDLARLDGGLVVRRAKPGERLVTLDDQERTLDPEDLVIADGGGAVGLAGVMGGARTELSASTRDVVIEAANFDPVSIGRTARRHRLPSEASRRFERGVDPAVARAAAERAVQLLVELAGGTADPGQTWLDTAEPLPPVVLPRRRRARAHRCVDLRDGDARRAHRPRLRARARGRRPRRHAAELARRPEGDRGPHRGGRPRRRLRPDPVGAARRPARPRPHPRPAAAPRRRHRARRERRGRGAVLSARLDRGAGRLRARSVHADRRTRSTAPHRCCGAACCPACWPPRAATAAAA